MIQDVQRCRALVSVLGASLASLSAGCTTPALTPNPHYVLGSPYQVRGFWFYPRETFSLTETGIATVAKGDAVRLTSDGEIFDQTALAAGHPTIQLPAIVRITNLENGRAVVVRLNDRGAGDPHRLLQITRRTGQLLAMPPDGTARVRLEVLETESHAAADALPGAPSLAITAAPRNGVEVAELAPLPGIRVARGGMAPVTPVLGVARAQTAAVPERLPEEVTVSAVRPNRLMVMLDTFEDYQYAAMERARMGAAGARIVSVREGRAHRFRVEIGPLADIAHADRVLDQAFASGIPDARIVVD
jgi:rare lipoprotein A